MKSLKKRLTLIVALTLMSVAIVVPVFAQDEPTPTPTPTTTTTTSIITSQITKLGGTVMSFSLPVRCGNDC